MKKSKLIGKPVRYSDECLRWYLSDDFVDMCTAPNGVFDKEAYEDAIEHVFTQILIPDYYPGIITDVKGEYVDVLLPWRQRPLLFYRKDVKVKP